MFIEKKIITIPTVEKKQKINTFHFFLRYMPNLPDEQELHSAWIRRLKRQVECDNQADKKSSTDNDDSLDGVIMQLTDSVVHIWFDACSFNPLTYREMVCMVLLAIGKNPDQCADIMGISTSSVLTYEKRVRDKLGARNRVHAFYMAIRCGYLKVI